MGVPFFAAGSGGRHGLGIVGTDNEWFNESDRAFALDVAQKHKEDAMQLSELAWKAATVPAQGKETYALALRQAEGLVRLYQSGENLNTLGVAQYRMGLFAEAARTLSKSNELNKRVQPADWAFLAMAHHRLGKKDEAQAAMNGLRELMKKGNLAQNPEAQTFLQEAEAVLKEPPGKEGDK
jgi:Flp pilus assembly protein TadD